MTGDLIWVIEDNDPNYELVEYLLGEAGHRVARARDRGEARRLATSETPRLVLLDMNLPSGSGLELVAELRAIPGFRNVPIVALTAHAMRGDRERFLSAGCDGYISKPIETALFLAAVERFLTGAPGDGR